MIPGYAQRECHKRTISMIQLSFLYCIQMAQIKNHIIWEVSHFLE